MTNPIASRPVPSSLCLDIRHRVEDQGAQVKPHALPRDHGICLALEHNPTTGFTWSFGNNAPLPKILPARHANSSAFQDGGESERHLYFWSADKLVGLGDKFTLWARLSRGEMIGPLYAFTFQVTGR